MTAPSRAWVPDGLCVQVGGDAWFPDKGEDTVLRAAKALCRECPVRVACLEYAMTMERGSHGQRHGCWGGTGPRERARLARRRAKALKAERAS